MPLFGVGIESKTNDKGNELTSKMEKGNKNTKKLLKNKMGKEFRLRSHFVNSPV